MVTGNERREVVQDANQPRPMQLQNLPLVGAQTPRAPSLQGLGESERKLTEALGSVGKSMVGGLTKYVETKRPEWELEGQMQYAEGVAEEEIAKSGNRYVKQGYMSMKARTSVQEWTTAMEIQLDEDDALKQMDSKSFQKMLMEQYKPLAKGIGSDPHTRELLGTIAATTIPSLIQKQIVANNKYNKEQQKLAATELFNSTATRVLSDPNESNLADFMVMLQPGATGLDRDDEIQVQSDSIVAMAEAGNPRVLEAIGLQAAQEPEPNYQNSDPQTFKNFIAKHESGAKGYDAVVHNKSGITPSEMTIGQVLKWQADQANADNKDTAIGKYQIIKGTLEASVKELGLSEDQMFDGPTQEILGTHLLKKRGFDDYLKGKITPEQFLKNVSQEWAAMPMDSTGRSYYEGQNGNRALTDWDSAIRALGGSAAQVNATAGLANMGFPVTEIVRINGAITKMNDLKSREFSQTRFETESNIAAQARNSGNLNEAYELIQNAMQQHGYNNEWGNAQYANAKAQVKAYNDEQLQQAEITEALDNNLLGTLSAEKQALAFEEVRKTQEAALADADPAEREQAIRDKIIEVSVANRVVDPKLKSDIRMGLLGDVYDKEGKANPKAMDAYSSWLALRQQDVALADDYVEEQHKKLLYEAMENDSRELGSPEALVTAAQTLYRVREEGYVPPKVDSVQFDKEIGKRIDKLRTSKWAKWFPGASDTDANDRGLFSFDRGITDEQAKMIRNNVRLKDRVMKDAQSQMRTNPNLSSGAAINAALTRNMSQAEIIAGNVILPPPPGRRSLKEAAGIADMQLKDNTINGVVLDLLNEKMSDGKSRAEHAFGEDWNRMQIFEDDIGDHVEKSSLTGAGIGAAAGFLPGPFAPVTVPVGTVVGGLVGAGVGAAERIDGSRVVKSVMDKFRGRPSGMLVDYNYDSEFITISIPLNKEGTEYLSKTMPISAKQIGAEVRKRANTKTRTQ